uniref:Uncharacterized protein n=1 Tax=Physcomitrium patens TaxID=3218 RepID=A0A2K1JD77_PHYPA|nr:hypothetical protein PHYPA_019764 [Physcomitrium patens]
MANHCQTPIIISKEGERLELRTGREKGLFFSILLGCCVEKNQKIKNKTYVKLFTYNLKLSRGALKVVCELGLSWMNLGFK